MQRMIVIASDVVPCQFTRNRGGRYFNCFRDLFLFLAVSLHDRDDNAAVKGKMCHSWLSPSELLGFEASNNLAGSVGLSPGALKNLSFFQRSKNCVSGLNSHSGICPLAGC